MSATIVPPNLQTTTADGSRNGYLTFTDPSRYVPLARAWLRDPAGNNPVECLITEVNAQTVGVAFLSSEPGNYGRSDVSAYLVGSTLNQWSPQVSDFVFPPGNVIILPLSSGALFAGQVVQFRALVRSSFDQRVTWSLQAPAQGSINASTGQYTAPAAGGRDTIIATSVADPTVTGTKVVFTSGPSIFILPGGATPSQVATGSLTATNGVAVSCARTASAYCLGTDGLLHLLGPNTVRVEAPGYGQPGGLLREDTATNQIQASVQVGAGAVAGTGPWSRFTSVGAAPDITLNSTDVVDPAGGSEASKIIFDARPGGQAVSGSVVFQTINVFSGLDYTQSYYMRCPTGQSGVITITAIGGGTVGQFPVTDQWQRLSLFCNNHALDGGGIGFGNWFFANLPVITVYVWGCNGTLGSIVSSLIRTPNNAPATRDAEVITVPNPMRGQDAVSGTWKMGLKATPLDTWANVFAVDSISVLLATGVNGTPNNARLLGGPGGAGDNTSCQFDVTDNSGGASLRKVLLANAFSGSAQASVVGLDVAGVLTGSPNPGAPSGTGTGVISVQPVSVTIGSPGGLGNFAFQGHMTDIFVATVP